MSVSETGRGTRASHESIEHVEAAFGRLIPIVREQLRDFAKHIHPDMRAAGMQVLRTALRSHRVGEGPVAVGDIILRTGMDKSVVSRQLRQLADWGLITTSRSPRDRRVILVAATDLALKRADVARSQVRMLNARILETWSEEDVVELGRLIERLVADRTTE